MQSLSEAIKHGHKNDEANAGRELIVIPKRGLYIWDRFIAYE